MKSPHPDRGLTGRPRGLRRLATPLLLLALTLGGRAAETMMTYDAAGRLIAADLGEGAFITYTYDANGNLLASRHSPSTALPSAAGLSVAVSLPGDPVVAGVPFLCRVTVTNAGPGVARAVRLTNELPAGAMVVDTTTTQGQVARGRQPVTADLGLIAAGTAAIVDLWLVLPAAGPTAITATAGSPDDGTPGDNSATTGPVVTGSVSLVLSARAGPRPLTLGTPLAFTFVASNAAPTVAAGVVLSSGYPAGATFLGATSSAGSIVITPGQVSFSVGVLAPGGTFVAQVRVAPVEAGVFTNRSTLTADAPDLDPRDNVVQLETPVAAPTLLVVNTNNAGPGSLRQALLDANAAPDRDIIAFDIPGPAGLVPTIPVVDSNLPTVIAPLVIDGFSQAGGMVELDGLGSRLLLTLLGGNSVVRGLALNRSLVSGLRLETGGENVVEGCFIGVAPDGFAGRDNGGDGIGILGLSANNRIGGPEPWQRNVIGANAGNGISLAGGGDSLIQGNYIGLAADGLTPLGNGVDGVGLIGSAGDVILGNVIAGNGRFSGDGINVTLTSGDTRIAGNRIGTDAEGLVARPNRDNGIRISSAFGVAVGDGTPTGRNVISGNRSRGISISAASGVRVAGNYIGIDASGTRGLSNGSAGVEVTFLAPGVVIGGGLPGDGNVISGNGSAGVDLLSGANRTLVQGNIIGLDAAGSLAVGNSASGVNLQSVSEVRIGGPLPGEGNVISGNTGHGIVVGVLAHHNVMQGNRIGTDGSGMLARSNSLNGVSLAGGSTNRVGGLAPGEGNLISGNGFDGVSVSGFTPVANRIEGNWLGLDVTGGRGLGNRLGISTFNGARLTRIAGNVIAGNRSAGMQLTHVSGAGAMVTGNYVGTDSTGLRPVGNPAGGIVVARSPNNTIGPGNVISGNGRSGVSLVFTNSSGNLIAGNWIGVGADGFTPVSNQLAGVHFLGASTNRVGGPAPGDGNVIAFNGAQGVQVRSDPANPAAAEASGNAILGNSIHANGGLGIELGGPGEGIGDGPTANDAADADAGPNRLQNFPVLTAVTTQVSGSITTAPGTNLRVEVFFGQAMDPSGFGEGARFVGDVEVTTDLAGVAPFAVALPPDLPPGGFFTATATDAAGNTSEFSPALPRPDLSGADVDGDGLADDWERQYFGDLSQGPLGDFDGDGASNFAEFVAGTDPTDPQSRLVLKLEQAVELIRLSWASSAGVAYQVEASANLTDWTVIGSVTGSGSLVELAVPRLSQPGFFRLRVEVPPALPLHPGFPPGDEGAGER